MVGLKKLSAILLLSALPLAVSAQAPKQGPGKQGPTAAVTKAGAELDARQVASLERVTKFFNSTATLVGKFHQIGPDGSKTEGTFYMQRPGRVRFQYEEPSPIEL